MQIPVIEISFTKRKLSYCVQKGHILILCTLWLIKHRDKFLPSQSADGYAPNSSWKYATSTYLRIIRSSWFTDSLDLNLYNQLYRNWHCIEIVMVCFAKLVLVRDLYIHNTKRRNFSNKLYTRSSYAWRKARHMHKRQTYLLIREDVCFFLGWGETGLLYQPRTIDD
jgi:hypothetical protein